MLLLKMIPSYVGRWPEMIEKNSKRFLLDEIPSEIAQ